MINQNAEYFNLMKNELEILEKTSHPNIMRIYELLADDKYYYIVSEYMEEGELHNLVKKGTLNEREIQIVMR